MDWIEKEIKFGDRINYQPRHKDYGRAEFTLCPVFKRGIIRILYIFPKQQESNTCYKLVLPTPSRFRCLWFSTFPDRSPYIWHTGWCKEHKCYSLEFYVPVGCDYFDIGANFGDTITLSFP